MDINDVRAFSTVLVAIVFAGVCWWAFAPSRRERFKEDANLIFGDEHPIEDSKTPSSEDEVRQD